MFWYNQVIEQRCFCTEGEAIVIKVEKIVYKRLYEGVLEQLGAQIRSGDLKPGMPLPPERELAEQFGVSRGTLREAFRIMENDGLIVSTPGGGRYISDSMNLMESFTGLNGALLNATLADLFEFRLAIEPSIAEIASAKATPDDISELEHAMTVMKSQGGKVNTRHDYYLHTILANATHNLLMIELIRLNLDLIERLRDIGVAASIEIDHYQSMIQEHEAIVEAVMARDGQRARQAMYEHLKNGAERRNIPSK